MSPLFLPMSFSFSTGFMLYPLSSSYLLLQLNIHLSFFLSVFLTFSITLFSSIILPPLPSQISYDVGSVIDMADT